MGELIARITLFQHACLACSTRLRAGDERPVGGEADGSNKGEMAGGEGHGDAKNVGGSDKGLESGVRTDVLPSGDVGEEMQRCTHQLITSICTSLAERCVHISPIKCNISSGDSLPLDLILILPAE